MIRIRNILHKERGDQELFKFRKWMIKVMTLIKGTRLLIVSNGFTPAQAVDSELLSFLFPDRVRNLPAFPEVPWKQLNRRWK